MGAKGSAIAKKKNEKSKEWTGSFIRNTRRETEGVVSAVFSGAVAGDRSSQNLMVRGNSTHVGRTCCSPYPPVRSENMSVSVNRR